jgi:hypothetical protein
MFDEILQLSREVMVLKNNQKNVFDFVYESFERLNKVDGTLSPDEVLRLAIEATEGANKWAVELEGQSEFEQASEIYRMIGNAWKQIIEFLPLEKQEFYQDFSAYWERLADYTAKQKVLLIKKSDLVPEDREALFSQEKEAEIVDFPTPKPSIISSKSQAINEDYLAKISRQVRQGIQKKSIDFSGVQQELGRQQSQEKRKWWKK